MSQQPISRSPDLARLRDEGYDLRIQSGHLVVGHIPYVNHQREVKLGTLVMPLDMQGSVTAPPRTHVMMFAGDYPCRADGTPLEAIRHVSGRRAIDASLAIDHSFSSKPSRGRYLDYHEKVATYAAILSGHAAVLDPATTPRPGLPIAAAPEESVFRYLDTASSRAGITALTQRLALGAIAIVGLGGTGSYVLDLVAKTPVGAIHLFDGDIFKNHNAFRAPGAVSIEALAARPYKVDHFAGVYGEFRRGIVPHPVYVDENNVAELGAMAFVFLCMDASPAKRRIVEHLEACGVPFIDVGMGLLQTEAGIHGQLRVTASTPSHRGVRDRIPMADAGYEDAYSTNIQVADLNALNATLAVIRWKKLYGFYLDAEQDNASVYVLDGNQLVNDRVA